MKIDSALFKKGRGICTNAMLLRSVEEYVAAVSYLRKAFAMTKPWYRGVSQTKYRPIPTAHRQRFWERHRNLESWIQVDFQNRARPFLGNSDSYSSLDWYFTMQHYGLPTRLLDWTHGSLIALFFAVRHPETAQIPAVYVMDPYWYDEVVYGKERGEGLVYNTTWDMISDQHKSWLSSYLESWEAMPPFPTCIEPPCIDTRIVAQKSVFTLHGKRIDPFTNLARRYPDARIAKIRLATKSCSSIKEQLRDSGISEVTVFPGLEGLIADIKWERGIR